MKKWLAVPLLLLLAGCGHAWVYAYPLDHQKHWREVKCWQLAEDDIHALGVFCKVEVGKVKDG